MNKIKTIYKIYYNFLEEKLVVLPLKVVESTGSTFRVECAKGAYKTIARDALDNFLYWSDPTVYLASMIEAQKISLMLCKGAVKEARKEERQAQKRVEKLMEAYEYWKHH